MNEASGQIRMKMNQRIGDMRMLEKGMMKAFGWGAFMFVGSLMVGCFGVGGDSPMSSEESGYSQVYLAYT